MQILEGVDSQSLEQRRGRHQIGLGRQQAAADQARIFVLGTAHAQGHVDTLVEQIDPPVGLDQFQLHLGVGREKTDHQLREQGDAARRTHAQTPAWLAGQAGDGFFGLFGFQQHGLAMA